MVRKKKRNRIDKSVDDLDIPLWMEKYSDKDVLFWLNDYNGLFSDFDPRYYKERSLSADFLDEAKRASKDKEKIVKIIMLVPKHKRDNSTEEIIRKRLKSHFQRHFDLLKKERGNIIKRGLVFVLSGIVLMFIASYILFTYNETSLLMSFLIIILEPGGWFLFWEGLYQVIFDSKVRTPDYTFYKKMAGGKIEWREYYKNNQYR